VRVLIPRCMTLYGCLWLLPPAVCAQVVEPNAIFAEHADDLPIESCQTWLSLTAASPDPAVRSASDAEKTDHRLEQFLIQTALGQVQRQGPTLSLRFAAHTFQLTDRCDDQQRVRYRLQDIRHLHLTWTVREDTGERVRYLLIEPASNRQLVLNTSPVFAPNQWSFAVVDEQQHDGFLQHSVQVYDWRDSAWQRGYDHSQMQRCAACRAPLWATASAAQPIIQWDDDQHMSITFAQSTTDGLPAQTLRIEHDPQHGWQADTR
jgi:hypothetical protein